MRLTTLDLFVLFASLITLTGFLSLAVIRGPEPKYFALIASSGLVALVKLVKAFRPA